ncbi:MAG: HI0074 family nucleotidyltransferase substrate-binding subunit [Thermoguttaceae bacterium]
MDNQQMNNESRFSQRLVHFDRAYQKFMQIGNIQNRSEWEDMAFIQSFEFTFELAWKLMKDYLLDVGFNIDSPKGVLRQAFQSGIIQSADVWLESLKVRNSTTHLYEDEILKKSVDFIQNEFLPILEQFHQEFSTKEV